MRYCCCYFHFFSPLRFSHTDSLSSLYEPLTQFSSNGTVLISMNSRNILFAMGRKNRLKLKWFWCNILQGLTEKFKEKDTTYSGSATFSYEAFMLTVLPFLIAWGVSLGSSTFVQCKAWVFFGLFFWFPLC